MVINLAIECLNLRKIALLGEQFFKKRRRLHHLIQDVWALPHPRQHGVVDSPDWRNIRKYVPGLGSLGVVKFRQLVACPSSVPFRAELP